MSRDHEHGGWTGGGSRGARSGGRSPRWWLILGPCICLTMASPTGADGDPSTRSASSRARFLMGTRLAIEVEPPVEPEVFEAAFSEVARLESVMSNWKSASEISRLNKTAGSASFRCSPDLFLAIRSALRWAEETGGAFDPTVEPLVRRASRSS